MSQFEIRRWEREQRKCVVVLVDSFEIYQARSVLVGYGWWELALVLLCRQCLHIPTSDFENTSTEASTHKSMHKSTHESKHESKHEGTHRKQAQKAHTESTESRKARKHRAREHESTRAQKAQKAQKARKHRKHRAHTHQERAKKAGYLGGALLVWVLLTAIGWRDGLKIYVGSYAG